MENMYRNHSKVLSNEKMPSKEKLKRLAGWTEEDIGGDIKKELAHMSAVFLLDHAQGTGIRQQIIKLAGCTKCGFCCKSTYPSLEEKEVAKLAKVLKCSVSEFLEKYCTTNPATGYYPSLDRPCPFLDNENVCKIYKVRPEVCKEYPFNGDVISYGPCTAANNIIKEIKKTDFWNIKIFDLNKKENREWLEKQIGKEKADERVIIWNEFLSLGDKITDSKYWQDLHWRQIAEHKEGDPKTYNHLRLGIWRMDDLKEVLKIMKGERE